MNIIKQTYIPGDKWLYIKLYTGYKTADRFLVEELPQILTKLKTKKILNKWFFIRYSDPNFHLRIRFCVNHKQNLPLLISILNKSINQYVTQELIWKVQFDTYQREIERYGYKTIEYAEEIFHIDSITIIQILSKLDNDQGDHQRWQIALKMIDNFLNDFEIDLQGKLNLLIRLSEGYKKEFGFNQQNYKLQLDKKYRSSSKLIYEIILLTKIKLDWFITFEAILNQKSKVVKRIAKQLIAKNQELEISISNLLESYIHMMINRLFRSNQRLSEMVLYDMLERFYSSEVAKIKYNSKNKII